MTVFLAMPNLLAIAAFGTPSEASLLISAQSSMVITLQSSKSAHFSSAATAHFSTAVDTHIRQANGSRGSRKEVRAVPPYGRRQFELCSLVGHASPGQVRFEFVSRTQRLLLVTAWGPLRPQAARRTKAQPRPRGNCSWFGWRNSRPATKMDFGARTYHPAQERECGIEMFPGRRTPSSPCPAFRPPSC